MRQTRYLLMLAGTFLLLACFQLKAQPYATVDVTQIALFHPKNQSVGVLPGAGSAESTRILGKPDRISDFYSEIDEDTLKLYHYGKCKLYFLKDKLDSWSLSDDRVWVGKVNGPIFKVGDKLRATTGQVPKFHDFPINRKQGVSRNLYFKAGSLMYLMNGNVQTDTQVELLFDSKNTLFSIAWFN